MAVITRLAQAMLVAAVALTTVAAPALARTAGEVVDDARISTEIKTKLVADKLSNLTKITVKVDTGVVTLDGTVDTPERRARATEIASRVTGVKQIVNNIRVQAAATTAPPPPPAPPTASAPPAASPATGVAAASGMVDATGTVASVDAAAGTITLTDGRVLRATGATAVWQPTTVQALKPGAQVLVRGATADGFQPAQGRAPEWHLGTVSRVDRAASQLTLTDGSLVRVTPATNVHHNEQRLTIDQVPIGSEVVIQLLPPSTAAPAGSALPRSTATAGVFDAAEVAIMWTPTASSR